MEFQAFYRFGCN